MNDKTLRKKAVEKNVHATSRATTTNNKTNKTEQQQKRLEITNQANERLVNKRKNFEALKKDIEGDIKMEVSSMLKD